MYRVVRFSQSEDLFINCVSIVKKTFFIFDIRVPFYGVISTSENIRYFHSISRVKKKENALFFVYTFVKKKNENYYQFIIICQADCFLFTFRVFPPFFSPPPFLFSSLFCYGELCYIPFGEKKKKKKKVKKNISKYSPPPPPPHNTTHNTLKCPLVGLSDRSQQVETCVL